MNGISIKTLSDTTNFNGSNDLIISNESSQSNNAAFGGYITYFTWVKGTALYKSNFTVSNDYPTLTDDYILLLKSTNFDGILGNSVINSNVSITQNVPPNFLFSNNNVSSIPQLKNLKSIFTDNSLVFYKKGCLAYCGVGSVRNSSIKSRKI